MNDSDHPTTMAVSEHRNGRSEGQTTASTITSSIHKTSMSVRVQPPSQAQVGTVLDVPFALQISINANGGSVDLGQYWVYATLLNPHSGVLVDGLAGNVAQSVQPLGEGCDSSGNVQGYALFDNITIQKPGHYKLQATVWHFDLNSGVNESLKQDESSMILVVEEHLNKYFPTPDEERFLDKLEES